MTAHIAGLADMLAEVSTTMQRWEDERLLERTDLVLARLLRAEAISGRRAECNASDASNMPMINGLLREAIAAHTGKPFRNPLFPE